jgi:NAD(P)H dehydrogenase (quinone)
MGKKILLILGHPDLERFNQALYAAYKKGALRSGAEIEEIRVGELQFDPTLRFGYRKRMNLEPCLLEAQKKIIWCDHIMLIYPIWWGSMPAVLKGFFDRVFLPDFAFKKRECSVWWDKFLIGKTARVISTLDQPPWFYKLVNGSPSDKAIKRLTFKFCGIGPTKIMNIGPLRLSEVDFQKKWLRKVEALGYAQK